MQHTVPMLLPPTHPRTELLEVVRITDPSRHLTSRDLAGETVAIWEAEQVTKALGLVAELPESVEYRCFMPGWGLRAHGRDEQLFEIAFCFRCHWVRIWTPDGAKRRTFDVGSPAAVELLGLLRSAEVK